MVSFFSYVFVAFVFVLVQSSVLIKVIFPAWQPSLIMVLVIIAGLREPLFPALLVGLVLGALQDSFSGSSLGLYVTVYLFLIFLAKVFSEQLNVESPPLLLFLVAGGTLIENVLIGVLMTVFADTEPVVAILIPTLPLQLITNLGFTIVLMIVIYFVQFITGSQRGLGALLAMGRSHGH